MENSTANKILHPWKYDLIFLPRLSIQFFLYLLSPVNLLNCISGSTGVEFFPATGWKCMCLWHVYSIFIIISRTFFLNLSSSISSIILIFFFENSNDLFTLFHWLFSLWSFLIILTISLFPFYFLKSMSFTLISEISNLFYSPSKFVFISLMVFFFFNMFLKFWLLQTWIIALAFQGKPLNSRMYTFLVMSEI